MYMVRKKLTWNIPSYQLLKTQDVRGKERCPNFVTQFLCSSTNSSKLQMNARWRRPTPSLSPDSPLSISYRLVLLRVIAVSEELRTDVLGNDDKIFEVVTCKSVSVLDELILVSIVCLCRSLIYGFVRQGDSLLHFVRKLFKVKMRGSRGGPEAMETVGDVI